MDHPLRTLFCTLVLWAAGDVAAFDQAPFDVPQNRVLLTLAPAPENPRNSEGAFATLGSGRIIFCYSSYYGGKGRIMGRRASRRFIPTTKVLPGAPRARSWRTKAAVT